MAEAARFYFYDTTGNELTDHPLNGMAADGMGSYIGTHRDGKKVRGTVDGFDWTSKTKVDVTINDFPGHKVVLVKFWVPNKEAQQTFYLAQVPTANRAKVMAAAVKEANDWLRARGSRKDAERQINRAGAMYGIKWTDEEKAQMYREVWG